MYLHIIRFLYPSEDFRSSAKRSVHNRVLELLRRRGHHIALVESAVEVLIIYAELGEMERKQERERGQNLIDPLLHSYLYLCFSPLDFMLLCVSRRHEQ